MNQLFWSAVIVGGLAFIIHKGQGSRPQTQVEMAGAYPSTDRLVHTSSDFTRPQWTSIYLRADKEQTKDLEGVRMAQNDDL